VKEHFMKTLVGLFFFLLVGGVVFGQSAQSVAPDSTHAVVYFYRSHRLIGAGLKPAVFVDGMRVGQLHNGDCLKISVVPGSHEVYSTDKSTGVELTAKAGEIYYVRVDIQTGMWHGYGRVTLVDPQEGQYEVGRATR
jgi:Protein of unknown function (DUF2846)